ncbi:MAG: BatA domain-containing protein [candidate division WOR-3 bacterium]
MGFVNPGLLPLAGFAAIPVIIHILSRLRLERKPFPSLLLLRTVRRERFSWLRLKEILLLVLRTLALFSLLLALARPYLSSRVTGLARAEDLVLVLDDSYSMSYGNRWRLALERARELVRSSGQGQRLAFLTASGIEIPARAGTQSLVLSLLDSLQPFAVAPTLDRVLSRAGAIAESLRAEVICITDLQERSIGHDWRVPARANFTLETVAGQGFDNAGIVKVFPEDFFVRAGRPNRLKVMVTNYSGARTSRTLALELDGQREEKVVELAPFCRLDHTFETVVARPSRYVGQVWLRGDSLPVDDRRFFVLNLAEVTPVLLVESGRVTGRYVRQALVADSTSGFRVDIVEQAALGRVNLRSYRAVIVADAFALAPADWNRLEFYLRSGGACLLMAGLAPVGPSSLSTYATSRGMSRPSGFLSVAAADTTHPALAGLEPKAFSGVHIWQHSRFDAGNNRVLVQLADSDPLVLEVPGERLVIWSISPTPDFSDLVYRAVFVPLLYQTVGYLCQIDQRSEYFAGDTIRIELDQPTPVTIVTPRGRNRLEPVLGQGRGMLILSDTRTPGSYMIESDTGPFLGLAVNPLPEEGDLTTARFERLTGQGFRIRPASQTASANLTPLLLYISVLAFCCELVLLVVERRADVRRLRAGSMPGTL